MLILQTIMENSKIPCTAMFAEDESHLLAASYSEKYFSFAVNIAETKAKWLLATALCIISG